MNLKDDSGCLQWVGLCLFVPVWLKQPWGCCSVLAWLMGNDTNILWLQIKLQWKTTYYICVLFMSVEGKLLADFLDRYWGISIVRHCDEMSFNQHVPWANAIPWGTEHSCDQEVPHVILGLLLFFRHWQMFWVAPNLPGSLPVPTLL